MAGCRVLNPDGTEQKGCRRRVPTPWRTFVRVLGLSHFTHSAEWLQGFDMSTEPLPPGPVQVDAISGSLMLVRRSSLDIVGPLDEGYFLHCEDLDWCMRFNQRGHKVLFVPDVTVTHDQGFSSRQRPVRVMWYMHKGMMRFYRKFFLNRYPLPLAIVVAAGVWFRFVLLVLQHYSRRLFNWLSGACKYCVDGLSRSNSDTLDESVLALQQPIDTHKETVTILGARSQIGHFLIPRLVHEGYRVIATSRNPVRSIDLLSVRWRVMDITDQQVRNWPEELGTVISLAPVWLLPDAVEKLVARGMTRLIAFSSTSRYSKRKSGVVAEARLAERLAEGEEQLSARCTAYQVAWTLFRPTMVYGCAMDSNVFSIAGFIRKFGCFLMSGKGSGCRQPVHADDLAAACCSVLNKGNTFDKAYNLSGGETISYRTMVTLIFRLLGRKPRIYTINRRLLNGVVRLVAVLPGFRHVNSAVLDRMEQDLCFDHSDAASDFSYAPRGFLQTGFNHVDYGKPAGRRDTSSLLEELKGKRILVTGAGGFIGYAMCRYLVNQGCDVDAVLRNPRQIQGLAGRLNPVIIDDICSVRNWDDMLVGVDSVIHLAGYVHERVGVLKPEARLKCKRLNVDTTTAIAQAAARTGVRRFIYTSSIKVHGESSPPNHPVTEFLELDPQDSYAHSKMQAEQQLREIAQSSQLDVVIFRPPLVYGPGVKANFLRLMRMVDLGMPMPLAAVENRRSLLYIENLVDVLALSIVHPEAVGQTFLVSDGQDVSTPMLISMLADSFNIKPRLFPVSLPVMRTLAAVGGERSTVDRLVQSLIVNSEHVRRMLDWTPPYSLETGIRQTAYWYQQLYDPVRSGQNQLAAYASTW
jgi:nucleoside-diphosphate-sugar epimerase